MYTFLHTPYNSWTLLFQRSLKIGISEPATTYTHEDHLLSAKHFLQQLIKISMLLAGPLWLE